jgi:hypothetical protein
MRRGRRGESGVFFSLSLFFPNNTPSTHSFSSRPRGWPIPPPAPRSATLKPPPADGEEEVGAVATRAAAVCFSVFFRLIIIDEFEKQR